jgi:FdrA protein
MDSQQVAYKTQAEALGALPGANLALISVPGQYAAQEARWALEHNLHVLIFSDNVPLADERALKELAQRQGLLVMGAECGAAIVNGTVLAFGNAVRRGPVGIVAGSGTGLMQVSVLVDNEGLGVSQAIGTGGRDLLDDIGGLTMLQGIDLLEADEETLVIVLVAKAPAPQTMQRVIKRIRQCHKPVVVNFLGGQPRYITKNKMYRGQPETFAQAGAIPTTTLEEAACWAVDLARGQPLRRVGFSLPDDEIAALLARETARRASPQKYLRGLFCGGHFAKEALLLVQEAVGEVYSNLGGKALPLPDPRLSVRHSIVDMGAEEFTLGRPHPMIIPRPIRQRLLQEGRDPEVAVLLLDVVLGYGAHRDPASILAPAIAQAREQAAAEGRYLAVVASVCGTEQDIQNARVQEQKLREVGVIVLPSNAQAARLAAMLVQEEGRRAGAAPAVPPYGRSGAAPDSSSSRNASPATPALLHTTLRVLNVGIRIFYEALQQQSVTAVHVDWEVPA